MPTPSEDTTMAPLSTDDSSLAYATYTTCPPEEARDARAELAAREHGDNASSSGTDSDVVHDEQMTSHATTPEPDTMNSDDKSISDDSLHSVQSPDAAGEAEARQASTPPPEYLYYPQDRQRRSCNATSSFLRPGSKFRGTQQSDRQVYDVQVEIKDVDMAESSLCGYLRIQGLTDDHPTLTTFFEGEIIGPKHLFKTTHPSWGSSEKVDLQHWARFPAWRPLAKSAKSPNFTLKNFQQREHLFMRWKEYFLVPDHRVKTITGASFEGFYYICFNQCSGSVSGIYFHAKSEKYQQLELQHVESKGCEGSMEFR